MKRVITFGTFDLLHEGHIKILKRAKALGDYLIVGVSSDKLNARKGKVSIFPQAQRLSYISALSCVNEVFLEESLEEKDDYIRTFAADLLVMGDDWVGRFDWVSCEVSYLSRTEGVSSSEIKTDIEGRYRCRKVLFGDTYIQKHYDCALALVNDMTSQSVIPIISNTKQLTGAIDCDCIVYFNKPVNDPPEQYKNKPRVLIDHGASTLKWFLASEARFRFFDTILTAGPDHTDALLSFFPGEDRKGLKVKSAGFVKSKELFDPPRYTRDELAEVCGLDASLPIILFAPTWHIFANPDMTTAIGEIAKLANEVTSLHPETAHLGTSELNVVKNVGGMTLELLKHADCVISDTSSTLFEAAALGKPTVQLLLREYSDNSSLLFDFPFVAGTCELFCAGVVAKPRDVLSAVRAALEASSDCAVALQRMQSRVLRGTQITATSGNDIVKELIRICDLDSKSVIERREQGPAARSLVDVHENMWFAKNKVIAHGGGNYKGHHASNSLEAIKAATRAVGVVELDLVLGSDGVLIVHDGFEQRFGLERSFSDVSVEEFSKMKFNGELTSITLETALKVCACQGKAIVCDVKGTGPDYEKVCQILFDVASSLGVISRTVVQCYCPEDFIVVHKMGFKRSLLAVWKKYYRAPLGEDVFAFLDECFALNAGIIVGVSIPYQNKHMEVPAHLDPRFESLFAYWKRFYVHGAPVEKYPELLRRNIGVFADSYSSECEFKDHPSDFNWVHYLFLNKNLVESGIDNQISATNHFVEYGNSEGRLSQYKVPVGFVWTKYIEKNASLRKKGVGCANSASAHWTRYGSNENRPY